MYSAHNTRSYQPEWMWIKKEMVHEEIVPYEVDYYIERDVYKKKKKKKDKKDKEPSQTAYTIAKSTHIRNEFDKEKTEYNNIDLDSARKQKPTTFYQNELWRRLNKHVFPSSLNNNEKTLILK